MNKRVDLKAAAGADISYQGGFGNEYASEALPGALPVGQNSPQKCPYGLYAEVFSGTSFTSARALNRRSWLYRIRPAVKQPAFRRIDDGLVRGAPFNEAEPTPNRLRWNPFPIAKEPADFIQGIATLAGCGDPGQQVGIAVHYYRANRSMQNRYFYNSDGEFLIVPQLGSLRLHTELGTLDCAPNEIAVIPRGVRYRVELAGAEARGWVCENFGALLRLPELGPVGSNCLANARDFQVPVAAYEDREGEFELVTKFMGKLWSTRLAHSPLDVVAWHGSYAPYRYDLARFNVVGSISYDHPDPSIFTVLTAPSDTPGTANVDFVIFPPRWLVAEHTFRPPWFHRNVMSEFMGLVRGQYDSRAEGFVPGGSSLHNCMAPHGPDGDTFEKASNAELAPHKVDDTMAFMFETRYILRPTRFALEAPELQKNYDECWAGIGKHFRPS